MLPSEVQRLLDQGKRMEAVERMVGLLIDACKEAEYKRCSEIALALARLAKEQDLLEWTARKLGELEGGAKEESVAAHLGLFYIYRALGRLPKAWHNLSLAVRLAGWDMESVILPEYRRLMRQKRYAEAGLSALERFKLSQNYAHLAELEAAYNGAKKAGREELARFLRWLREACNLSGDDIGARLVLVLLKAKEGKEVEAAQELEGLLREYPRFLAALRVAVDLFLSLHPLVHKLQRYDLLLLNELSLLHVYWLQPLMEAGDKRRALEAYRERVRYQLNETPSITS
ncbi:MAG TPA: hypothetical protein EYP65_03980 [Armatimonadetes bacterium]|nr:hypothetical protein [Armatimonadota bacterium]